MDLNLDTDLAIGYKSPSQRIRVLSEHWLANNAYCPRCSSALDKARNNSRVLDFVCLLCGMSFELKSKRDPLGSKLVDGAYGSMMDAILSGTQPNFFFLSYDTNLVVRNLALLPRRFITSEIVEKRRPLSTSARRAGWTGCNLLLSDLPIDGMIAYVRNGVVSDRESVMAGWRSTAFLDAVDSSRRGWTVTVMNCIEQLQKDTFTLEEVYGFVSQMQARYPENKHIKPKIRQQLQLLRDEGWLTFLGDGIYSLKAGRSVLQELGSR